MAHSIRIALLAGLVLAVVGVERVDAAGKGAPPRQALLPGGDGVEFVSNDACLGCHAEQAQAWRGSHHDLAMQSATPQTVLGDFTGAVFEQAGVTSRFFRRGDRFFVNTEGPAGSLADFEIAYTFGIDPLQQYLVQLPGGRLQALGIAWATREERWFHLYPGERIAPDDALHWTGRSQGWNYMCAECHSTDLRKNYDAVQDQYSTTWAEMNVSCQACHGPGERHVSWAERAKKAGQGSGGGDGGNALVAGLVVGLGVGLVVDLEGADSRAAVDACARCHARRQRVSEEDMHGRALLDDFVPSLIDPPLYHADGQILDEVYVYGSFVQSRMYEVGVRCSDCHDPHSLQLRAKGNAVCTACHQASPDPRFSQLAAMDYDTPEHHHHAKGSDGAQCVSCHMPSRTYMVIDPRRDHSLRVPRPDLSVKLGLPNACNGCHEDQSAGWAAEAVRRWFGPVRERGADFATAIHDGRSGAGSSVPALSRIARDSRAPAIVRATAISLLGRLAAEGDVALAAALADDDALIRTSAARAVGTAAPRARLSLLAPLLEDPVRAPRHEAARQLAGAPPDLLGAVRASALERSLEEYERTQLSLADQAPAWLNLAVLYANTGRQAEAERAYLRAIERDADFLPARVNLANLYNATGRNAEAGFVLREALVRAPDEGELHYSLGLLLGEEQRMEEAAAAFARAATLMPERARVHYNLGLARQHLKQPAAAAEALQRAAQLEPADASIQYAIAVLHAQQGRTAEALVHARRASALAPGDQAMRQLLMQLSAGQQR